MSVYSGNTSIIQKWEYSLNWAEYSQKINEI